MHVDGADRSRSLPLAGLALLALGAAPAAQGPPEVVLKSMPSGGAARLCTPDGAPVIGGSFCFQVHGAPPNALGVLLYSGGEAPLFDPALGATVWPEQPWLTWFFGTGPSGSSPVVLDTPNVSTELSGAQATFQAAVLSPFAQGGFVLSNGVRLQVGLSTEPGFGPVIETTFANYIDARLADVDGDGTLDLVAGIFESFTAVHYGIQTGGFHPPTGYGPVGKSPRAPLVLDVSGDGNNDLVTANTGSDDVTAILLDGAGGGLTSLTFPAGSMPAEAVPGDFDLDGHLDLVVGLKGGNSAVMLRGTGVGLFHLPVPVTVGAPQTNAHAADLDEDGALDLVLSADGTAVLLGNGDGTFGAPTVFGPASLEAFGVHDLDGDGSLDVAGRYGANIFVQRGFGDGTLGAALLYPVAPFGAAKFVDLDQDGIREALLLATGSGERLYVAQGLPGAKFGASTQYSSSHRPNAFVVSDIDLDGDSEVLFVGSASGSRPATIGVVYGAADGSLKAPRPVPIDGSTNTTLLVRVADLDGDGAEDVVALPRSNSSHLAEPILDVAGGGTKPTPVTLGTAETNFVLADFDVDLNADLLTSEGGTLRVRPGDGAGLFGTAIATAAGSTADQLAAADFDGDGALDLAVAQNGPAQLSVLLGNGDGTFGAASVVSADAGTVLTGLLDGDLFQDLAVVSATSVTVLLGNGDGTFGALTPQGLGSGGALPRLGDVDGDGELDLVALDAAGTTVAVARGVGDGTFLAQQTSFLGSEAHTALTLLDGDDDGNLDAAAIARTIGEVRLALGNGDGTFAAPLRLAFGADLTDLAAGDLDGDGIDDLTAGDQDRDLVWMLVNGVGE